MDLKKTAILLTAHPAQQKWWASVLLALEPYPGPLILAYDDLDTAPIPDAILSRFAYVVSTGYHAGVLGQGKGELLCLRNGFRAAADIDLDYVLKLAFDEPPWRWRNLSLLVEQLQAEQLDIIDCQTRIIFGRAAILKQAIDYYDVERRQKGSAESHWNWLMGTMEMRRQRIDDRLWWERLLGLIHLQGEYAANCGQPNKWSWSIGELWPRQ